ncbi:Protein of unknown function [Gryllus bimaculatus]|nr:Protein of unknown function [Gryllus bimaculatus]
MPIELNIKKLNTVAYVEIFVSLNNIVKFSVKRRNTMGVKGNIILLFHKVENTEDTPTLKLGLAETLDPGIQKEIIFTLQAMRSKKNGMFVWIYFAIIKTKSKFTKIFFNTVLTMNLIRKFERSNYCHNLIIIIITF